jgi:hypothetical protein
MIRRWPSSLDVEGVREGFLNEVADKGSKGAHWREMEHGVPMPSGKSTMYLPS